MFLKKLIIARPLLTVIIVCGIVGMLPTPHPPVVYLTFDDGPGPRTQQILDVLKEYDAKGTFFVIGIKSAYHYDLIQTIAADGHALGNHTWQHERLPTLTRSDFDSTILKTQKVLHPYASKCLRPPYGNITRRGWAWAGELGFRVHLWDIDTRDWTRPGVPAIVSSVLDNVQDGSNILMHENEQTVEALNIIVPQLFERGYRFEPLCEIPKFDDIPLRGPFTAAPTVVERVQVGPDFLTDHSSPLLANFEQVPTSHHGYGVFNMRLVFSEEVDVGYIRVRDRLMDVSGGQIVGASRIVKGRNNAWNLTIIPDGVGLVRVVLRKTEECGDIDSICTKDGNRMSHRLEYTVMGPPH